MQTGKSTRSLILSWLIIMVFIGILFFIFSGPVSSLLGESINSLRSALHGLSAGIFVVTMTIGFYQAFRLWQGIPVGNPKELGIGAVINTIACFFTIVFGNWLYIPYRAQGGPRSFFVENMPPVHKVFFEFKEFTALFTFPLVVAATYIILVYADHLNTNKKLREMVSLLLGFAFFFFIIAFPSTLKPA